MKSLQMKSLCAAVFLFSSVSGVALAQSNGAPAWTSPFINAATETEGNSTERSAAAEEIHCACTVPSIFA